MDVIGLAGPPGSGKSAVARRLARRDGVAWLDLDRLAWTAYAPGSPAHAALVERFGKEILEEDGRIDRSRLAASAFADVESRHALEAIVHPAVSRALASEIARRTAQGTEVLLVEGALLGISPHVDYDRFDALLWLEASPEIRRQRLAAAGREHHAARWREERPIRTAVRVDAEQPVEHVAEAAWAAIVSEKTARRPLSRYRDPPASG
jgi:dephospho-CoA kinase